MNDPKKALMIQLRRIGDVLMCTPSIRAFKKRYPSCQLDFLTELPEILDENPYLNSIISVDRSRQYNPFYQYRLIRDIARSRYDLVVDFFANPRSAYYSFLSGAPVRLSYGFGHRKWAYNLTPAKSDDQVYAAMDRLNLLKSVDVPPDECRLDFYPSDSDRREAQNILKSVSGKPFVTVSPVSRRLFNRWPLERYAEIIDLLESRYGFSIVILAGPGETGEIKRLAGLISAKAPLLLTVERLGLLGAIFEQAFLHLGNDNGPKHIAVACKAPTFTIYGPHSHISWTYPDSKNHKYIRPADTDENCRQPGHVCGHKCISKIPVEPVWDRLSAMIDELRLTESSVKAR